MREEANRHFHSDDEIDLSELFSILWMRKWFILLCAVLSIGIAHNYLTNKPDRYTASILLMFAESSSKTDTLQNLMTGGLTAVDNTDTELELLKGRRFAGRIIDNLQLTENKHYRPSGDLYYQSQPSLTAEKIRTYAIDRFIANLSISQTMNTNLVRVSFESYDARHSALVANEIANTFIYFKEDLLEVKNRDKAAWLQTKLTDVKDNLQSAEDRISNYQTDNGFVDIYTAIEVEKSKLSKLTQEKYDKNRIIQRQQILRAQVLRYKSKPEELFNIPDVSNSPALHQSHQKFIESQDTFNQLKLRYGHKHPAYKKAQQSLLEIKQQLSIELENVVNLIDKKLQLEKSSVLGVERSIKDVNNRLKKLGAVEFENQKLRREFDANLKLYESLMQRLKESELMNDLAIASNITLVEHAEVPTAANDKKAMLIYTLAALVSIIGSATIVLIESLLASKVLQFRKVAKQFDTRIVGIIPKIKVRGTGKKPLLKINIKKHNHFLEALRTTRTNILLDPVLSKQKVIAFTSINPNDGKSTLSMQMAESFAELERTILMDADLRYPSIGKSLGIDVNKPGLTHLIAKKSKLSESVHQDHRFKYHVLTAGFIAKNPLLYLSQPRLKKVIDVLKSRYKRVVLECPPVMSVSDAFVISKHVDSVFLVVDLERTNKAELITAMEELRQAKVNIGGLILNKVKKSEKYYSGYYPNSSKGRVFNPQVNPRFI